MSFSGEPSLRREGGQEGADRSSRWSQSGDRLMVSSAPLTGRGWCPSRRPAARLWSVGGWRTADPQPVPSPARQGMLPTCTPPALVTATCMGYTDPQIRTRLGRQGLQKSAPLQPVALSPGAKKGCGGQFWAGIPTSRLILGGHRWEERQNQAPQADCGARGSGSGAALGSSGVSTASPDPGPVAGLGPRCTQAEVCLEFAEQTCHCSQVSVSLGGDALPWGQPPARPTPWLLPQPVITSPAPPFMEGN